MGAISVSFMGIRGEREKSRQVGIWANNGTNDHLAINRVKAVSVTIHFVDLPPPPDA